MSLPVPPWRNIIVRYCPRCRLVYPRTTERCERCQEPLVDQVRREPLVEK
jgi:predicted amidophosphoribosyltransferase